MNQDTNHRESKSERGTGSVTRLRPEKQTNAVVKDFFSTPIAMAMMPRHKQLNSELARVCLDWESQGDRYRNPIRYNPQQGNIWESHFNFFSSPEKPVQTLARFVTNTLASVAEERNGRVWQERGLGRPTRISFESWFHITRYGGRHGLHNHPNSSWSGIYYVRAGDHVPEDPTSGKTRFYDPRGLATSYGDPGSEFMDASVSVDVTPQEGLLVVFPSFIFHEVLTYFGQSERITIPFNARFKF